MGLVSQLRPMGGAIVLAISTSVFNSYTRPRVADILGSSAAEHGDLSGDYVAQLPLAQRERVTAVLAHGYNLQMIVLCAFAAAQVPASLLMWKKKQITV
jgi:hypothetical protein